MKEKIGFICRKVSMGGWSREDSSGEDANSMKAFWISRRQDVASCCQMEVEINTCKQCCHLITALNAWEARV